MTRSDSPDGASEGRWLVLAEGERRRWGGDLRRAFIFRRLAERTDAVVVAGFTAPAIRAGLSRATVRRPRLVGRRTRPRLATAELLPTAVVDEVVRRARPVALDVHDDPLAQDDAFGYADDPDRRERLQARGEANRAAFAWLIVPSDRFGDLVGIDPARRIVAPNGSDTAHIVPGPLPQRPTVGFVSGAAEGRGIETLVEACRALRASHVPDLELRLWLVATNDTSRDFLGRLARGTAGEPWIAIGPAPYDHLGETLAKASILCVPHPASPYLDAAVPVKLLDSMAAGRPLVVTPRLETRRIVEAHEAGLVTEADDAEALAASLATLVDDPAEAARLGANGRRAAETVFDWGVIGDRLADAILEREG